MVIGLCLLIENLKQVKEHKDLIPAVPSDPSFTHVDFICKREENIK